MQCAFAVPQIVLFEWVRTHHGNVHHAVALAGVVSDLCEAFANGEAGEEHGVSGRFE